MMNAIITGATKGIGKAISVALAKQGYNIIMCARNIDDLSQLAKDIEIFGVKVLAVKTDCAIETEVLNFIDEALVFAPTVNVLVNNVGVYIPSSLLDEEDSVFKTQQQVNVNTAYLLSKYIGRKMREQRSGHIFNICSVASKAPVENAGSYSVTKAAMLSLNNVLRKELASHQVKVTAIIPGATYTSSWDGTSLDRSKFVQAEDIANTIITVLNLSNGANVDEVVVTPLNF